MTTTTLYGQAAQTVDGNGSGNAGTVGTHFTVSAACTLDGVWFYSSTGCTQLPASIALWTTQASPATGTLVTSNTATWLTSPGGSAATAGSGWAFAAFTSPPSLASGTQYMAGAFRDDAVNTWFVYLSTYTWPKAVSPITAPKDVGNGQGWYDNTDTTLHFPAAQLASYNWYLDVQVSTGTAHTASASVTVTPATAAQGGHLRTAGASLTVSPSPSAPVAHGQHAATALTVTPATSTAGTAGTAAALTVTPSAAAAAAHEAVRPAAVTVTPATSAAGHHPHTALAALTVTPSVSAAAGGQSRTAAAALTAAPSTAAGARHGNARAAALTVTPSAAAAATIGSGAAVTVTPGVSAAARVTRFRAAAAGVTPATSAAAVHGHAATAAVAVTPAAAGTATGGSAGSAGKLLTEAGGALLAESGGYLLSEAGGGASAHNAAAALTVPVSVTASAPAGSAGKLLTEAGGGLLTEAGGYLLSEGAGGGGARTASASLQVAAATAAAASGGTPVVPFPRAPLDLDCELLLGGTWTSTKPWVYQRAGGSPPVTLTRGRPDESSQANPASSRWEWNNRDGRFSPRNPLSPYYGQLSRNTPVRFSIPAGSSYLRLENGNDDRAAIVDSAGINISGSIEMRLGLRLTDWRACVLAAKQDGGGCWQWLLNDDGTMTFGWQVTEPGPYLPVTSDVPVPYASGDFALRVIMDAATATVTFYAAPGASLDPASWAQLGDSLTYGTATSIAVASSPLCIGWSAVEPSQQLRGRVYAYRLYDKIGGTVAASPDFTVQQPGTLSFPDAQGNTWLIQGGTSGSEPGAEISGRNYRFHGEMSSQPPKWDVTGKDMAVAATAGGPLRRLGQGSANAMSAMKRAVVSQAAALSVIAYWPMEDAAGAGVLGPAAGPYPMTFGQNPAPSLASDSSFVASAPLPTANGAPFTARIAPHHGSTAWATRYLCKAGTLPGSGSWALAKVSATGECTSLLVSAWSNGDLRLTGYRADGTTAFDSGQVAWAGGSISGQALWWSVEAAEVAGGVQYSLVTIAPGAPTGYVYSATVATSAVIGNVTAIQLNPYGSYTDTVFGHLSHQTAAPSIFDLAQPLDAWDGETAAARYARLAEENGYQARVLGSPARSALMGPQGTDTLGNLLRECEAADLGLQFEPRQQLALGYRTLASMLNQAPAVTADYAASQPGGITGGGAGSGLDPVYDDQLTRNDWTLTRGSSTGTQGATWQAQLNDGSAMSVSSPPAGVGDYANTKTVNVQADSQLPDVAGWMVSTGSVDEERWPQLPFNLARPEIQGSGLYYPLLDAECGDYLQLDNMPEQVTYDPVRQLALGMTEGLGGFRHTLAFNAAPESPYEVMVLGDPVLGAAGTDGSVLHQDAAADATSLVVAAAGPSGIGWTTDPADFPFDVAIGGERVTVHDASGTGTVQTLTVTRAVNGVSKPQPAGTGVRLWSAPILSLA